MPTYDFKCFTCEMQFSQIMSFAEHDEFQENGMVCKSCGDGDIRQVHLEAPSFSLPAGMSTPGSGPKFVGKGTSGKESNQSRVPINIFDEKPDGGYKVTRIGRKEDIDNGD